VAPVAFSLSTPSPTAVRPRAAACANELQDRRQRGHPAVSACQEQGATGCRRLHPDDASIRWIVPSVDQAVGDHRGDETCHRGRGDALDPRQLTDRPRSAEHQHR
jgi:hypothetical protein